MAARRGLQLRSITFCCIRGVLIIDYETGDQRPNVRLQQQFTERFDAAHSTNALPLGKKLRTVRSQLPDGETWRYSVIRVTPSSLQRSPTIVSFCPIAAMAKRTLASVILNERRPILTLKSAALYVFVSRKAQRQRGGGQDCNGRRRSNHCCDVVLH